MAVVSCVCGRSYQVPDQAANQTLTCPACGQSIAPPQANPFNAPLPGPGQGMPGPTGMPMATGGMPGALPPAAQAAPQRQHQAAKSGGVNPMIYVGVGVGALLIIGVIVTIVVMSSGGGGGGLGGVGEIKTANWQKYNSTEGKYSIDLPGAVQKKVEMYNGVPPEYHYANVSLGKGGGTYTVVHAANNPTLVKMVGPTALLRNAAQSLAMKMNPMGGGGGNNSRPISLNGHPGYTIEAQGQIDGRQEKVRGRIYLVGSTVYQIYWMGPASRVPDGEIQKMFDSFKLSNPPAPTKQRKGRRLDPSKPRKSSKKPTGKKPNFER